MTDGKDAEPDPPLSGDGDPFSTDELDRLYQQAIEAMDAVDWGDELPGEGADTADAMVGAEHRVSAAGQSPYPKLHDSSEEGPDESTLDSEDELVAGRQVRTGDAAAATRETWSEADASFGETSRPRVTPRQILEAALFVGGTSLTARKLCGVLRGDSTPEIVETMIQDLNARYTAEGRPYEIRFGEGGYRLCLRDEFDRVRSRVFGLGPKEVKLSQEALEVLAVVAYQQPISREAIEKIGKQNAGSLLRQLLRRELLTIERESAASKEVQYRTSARFLQVFGLGDLDELPQAEELDLK